MPDRQFIMRKNLRVMALQPYQENSCMIGTEKDLAWNIGAFFWYRKPGADQDRAVAILSFHSCAMTTMTKGDGISPRQPDSASDGTDSTGSNLV